jgi:putative nucleotidyltransferase with HDIG domain
VSGAATLEDRLGAAESIAVARRALGAEEDAWIVGGAVRNAILGEEVADADLAVPAGREQDAARAIAGESGGVAFALSERHATWRAIESGKGWHVDVTALRAPRIEDDLRQRDFTVNAVAVALAGGEPVDPTGGVSDAERRTLRATAEEALLADPLRLLRAPRIAAAHSLEIDPVTQVMIGSLAPSAADAAGERQLAELRQMIGGPEPMRSLSLMQALGLTPVVLPELAATRGVIQNPNHHLDVHDHTLAVLGEWLSIEADLESFDAAQADRIEEFLAEPLADEMSRGQALRWGALFHDLGKPDTREEREGTVTFIGHDRVGAELIEGICRRLRTSRALSDHLQGLALHHLRLGFMIWERPLGLERVYDYLRATEPVGADVTLLSVSDRLAARGSGPLASEEMVGAHLDVAREMLAEALAWHAEPPRPPLSGEELRAELGVEPGPRMGEILERLRAAAFAGEVPDRASAMALARRLASE